MKYKTPKIQLKKILIIPKWIMNKTHQYHNKTKIVAIIKTMMLILKIKIILIIQHMKIAIKVYLTNYKVLLIRSFNKKCKRTLINRKIIKHKSKFLVSTNNITTFPNQK